MSVESQVKEVVQESREWIEDQIDELSKQAKQLQQSSRKQVKLLRKQSRKQIKQLQKQSRKLRKTLRREARKRSRDWTALLNNTGEYLQNQGESLKVGLAERGGKITQNVFDFGGKTTQQNPAERRDGFTQELAKQGQRLLEPVRRRDRTFWSIVGFSIGLVAAGTITFQLVRRRMAQLVIEEEEHIELPSNNSWNGTGRPAGEITYIDQQGTPVATLEIVDVETIEPPADAAFVGVKSTKHYYPVNTELESKDLVYFSSEEEAKAQGFNAAE